MFRRPEAVQEPFPVPFLSGLRIGEPLSAGRSMSLVARTFRRPGFPEEEVSRLRSRLEEFLKRTELAESALIIEGLGPGLSSHFVALSLLGPERVGRFQSIHSFCTGSFGVLFFLAWQKEMLLLTPENVGNFNRMFRAGHNTAGRGRGSHLLLRMLFGAPYMFHNDATEEVLTYSMHPEFLHMKVSELPENVSFLTYCVEDRKLFEIRRNSPFADWSMRDVARCVGALKRIYEPFQKDGKTYMDAVTDRPQLRDFFRNIRGRHRHVLFLHMDREGIHENTTYLKMHSSGHGKTRVMLDFLYLIHNRENRDLDEGVRVGLFGARPI